MMLKRILLAVGFMCSPPSFADANEISLVCIDDRSGKTHHITMPLKQKSWKDGDCSFESEVSVDELTLKTVCKDSFGVTRESKVANRKTGRLVHSKRVVPENDYPVSAGWNYDCLPADEVENKF